jgi:hypothetical protein
MKVFLAFEFSCCFLLGFGQEREPLELPMQLKTRACNFRMLDLPKVDGDKELRVYRVKMVCVFTSQTPVPVSGLPAQYEAFFPLNQSFVHGWDESAYRSSAY